MTKEMEVIATVTSVEAAERLYRACAPDYFRVNASHMDTASLGAFCAAYGAVPGLSAVPLYIDLQGAKLRVHAVQPLVHVAPGDRVALVCVPDDATSVPAPQPETDGASEGNEGSEEKAIYVTENILRLLAPGTEVGIDDARVLLAVETVEADGRRASATVRRGGAVRPRKGFNLRPHPVTFTALSARDRAHVAATRAHAFVRYALSFACLPSEVAELRALAGAEKAVAVKLERPLADDAAVALGAAARELWLCRGDMGAQLGAPGALAVYYRGFCARVLPRLRAAGCRVVMAGEVLDHMCGAEEPTRSEVCHLADLHERGFAAIVVSNETAYGRHPVEVLRTFRDVAHALATDSTLTE